MRKILALILLLVSICLPVQASEQDIVNSFTNFVNSIVKPIQNDFNGEHYSVSYNNVGKFYYKSKESFQYSYDLKRTGSLINPYEGYLELSITITRYQNCATKELAEQSNTITQVLSDFTKNRYTYKYNDGTWVKIRNQSYDYRKGYYFNDDSYPESKYKCYDEIRK